MSKLEKSVRILLAAPFLILAFVLLGPMLLAGCAKPPPNLSIPVPESLRSPCPRPDPASVVTVGDLAAFSVEQEAALGVCDVRRASAVAIIDAANEVSRPKRPWWRSLLTP